MPDFKVVKAVGEKYPAVMIAMSSTAFTLVNAATGLTLYGYDGTPLAALRMENTSGEFLREGYMSLTSGTVAIIDNADKKV